MFVGKDSRNVNLVYCFVSGARRAPFKQLICILTSRYVCWKKREVYISRPKGAPAVNIYTLSILIYYGEMQLGWVDSMGRSVTETP